MQFACGQQSPPQLLQLVRSIAGHVLNSRSEVVAYGMPRVNCVVRCGAQELPVRSWLQLRAEGVSVPGWE